MVRCVSDTTQYIYLLQEREFRKTKENIFKVGMTKKENHKRFNQYPKNSILLFQMICYNCKKIEKLILKKFNETFKQRKDIGNEYFEGEYKIMIDIIYLTINEEEEEEEEEEEDEDEDDDKIKFNLICKKIGEKFPDYKNDESFGGNKKYIIISTVYNSYVVYYLNSRLIDELQNYYYKMCKYECDLDLDYYIIRQYEIDKNVADNLQYFNHLINKKIVCADKLYDINSPNFISKINKTKFDINLENYDDFQNHLLTTDKIYCTITEKIRQLFHCNAIVNTCLYTTIVKEDETYDIFKKFEKFKDYDKFRIDIGINSYNIITLYKINLKYYDYETFLRKYTPYVIQSDINNNYYVLNRDYEYIGLNKKSINFNYIKSNYLFKDEPWNSENFFIKLCKEYEKIIMENSLNECLNMHNSTKKILTLSL